MIIDFIEDNITVIAGLLGVFVGGFINSRATLRSAKMAGDQAAKDRAERRRYQWINRLADALVEVDTIRGRLTVLSMHMLTTEPEHPISTGIKESLAAQRTVRQDIRAVRYHALAGGDTEIAAGCEATEGKLKEFVKAAYAFHDSLAEGDGTSHITGDKLLKADADLGGAIAELEESLGKLR